MEKKKKKRELIFCFFCMERSGLWLFLNAKYYKKVSK